MIDQFRILKYNRTEEGAKTMDYKRNRRYFEMINWIFVAILVVIIAILLYLYIWIGIISLLGLGTYIFFKLRDMPTDEDIEAVYKEKAQIIFQKGYQKLGLDPDHVNEMDPVMVHGPCLEQISYDPAVKRGKDGQVRSSNHEISIFYFSENQIHVYNHCFSVIDDEQNETIGEYFYSDIVSISTALTTTMYFDDRRKQDAFTVLNTLELTGADGEKITCSIQDLEKAQPKIQRIKDLLRMKKRS